VADWLEHSSLGICYLSLFRAGEGEGSKKEEWHSILVTPVPVQVGSLTATSPFGNWLSKGQA